MSNRNRQAAKQEKKQGDASGANASTRDDANAAGTAAQVSAAPVTTLDPARIGAGDDVEPGEGVVFTTGEAATAGETANDGEVNTDGETTAGVGSGQTLPPAETDEADLLVEEAARPVVEIPPTDYRVFFNEKPALQAVPGHVKRMDFDLDHETAGKLNRLWGAMQARNVIGPNGLKVDRPERALAVLIHFAHDAAAELVHRLD